MREKLSKNIPAKKTFITIKPFNFVAKPSLFIANKDNKMTGYSSVCVKTKKKVLITKKLLAKKTVFVIDNP
jgi:hypothetical protein